MTGVAHATPSGERLVSDDPLLPRCSVAAVDTGVPQVGVVPPTSADRTMPGHDAGRAVGCGGQRRATSPAGTGEPRRAISSASADRISCTGPGNPVISVTCRTA